ncbi:alpha/beta fold hydrolase [Hoeflea sp. WL0058]|uniref:Alpha/beta fold hydrolase n=2 Tax=Flavimaribacter sediminis TaxID=2865987 RepID=A0AAE2ZST4_9HYPH|nr:alpha/beta hydrolase [Flavimaribacter sediminis]MBW8640185.1 alpha/beta fold hydrolase [Flavimaribacter sediminis]
MPASRKTRALLGFLVLSEAPQRRDRLCDLFWDVPDDPRGALRWSLSKLRPLMNTGGRTRLLADRERVQIDPGTISVDFHKVRMQANGETEKASTLEQAWERANHLLMENCELPNQSDFGAWLEHKRGEVSRLRIRLARHLAMSGDAAPENTEVWAERWLMDAPFDPVAAQCAVAAKRRLGRQHEAESLAEEMDRAFSEAGLDQPDWSVDPIATGVSFTPIAHELNTEETPQQVVRFAQSEDDISLAWATVGKPDNPPLVKAANWLSHLELDWEAPIWSPQFRELAKSYHFIRYDERGCGLSDWDAPEISFESFVKDLELVADAAGLERFPLLGISQGAAVSIEFAARHPDRVSHLILFGGYAAGWRHTASPEEVREREAVMVLTETGWGRANPSYRHLFSQTFMPSATADELAWFDEFQARTTSPENAVRFLEAFSTIDVRERLKDIRCPTMVIHSRNDLRIPMSSGRSLAAQIPNAEFVGLESENHLLIGREPASMEFLKAVRRFLQTEA